MTPYDHTGIRIIVHGSHIDTMYVNIQSQNGGASQVHSQRLYTLEKRQAMAQQLIEAAMEIYPEGITYPAGVDFNVA